MSLRSYYPYHLLGKEQPLQPMFESEWSTLTPSNSNSISTGGRGLDAKVDRLDAKVDRDDGKISRIEIQTQQQAIQLTRAQADIKKIGDNIEGMDLAGNGAEDEVQDVEHRTGVKQENA
ncbi:uncharacterized protein L201_000222 [Kwoniella dendrophila CBS 6074]|uniref:t-SNARE coiled-coil homology domain-containing protein n=1 Tax=Kwoniella dendrophila CBS 6074 TaxID=1295534 RepID=A0AAX4JKS7_9TREE